MTSDHAMPGAELARFAAGIEFDDLPEPVVRCTEELFLDWIGSALAGRGASPVTILDSFAMAMGPDGGESEMLATRTGTSAWFAALVNAASSHVVEQDDLHNSSVLHPATVVFPAALAVAQEIGASGREFVAAVVAGYEVGIRVGEFLGRSHYRVFHTTGTAGTLAAAAAVGRLLRLDAQTMLHTFGSAGTQASGLWEFLREGADSKQLHTAKAAADGLLAAYLARDGFTGAGTILEGPQGMAAGMSSDADPDRLVDRLGTRWAIAETSFKFHASCRHTHPAADALLAAMAEHHLTADDIAAVTCHVHQGAIDVLGPVTDPQSVHQSKFSMGTVLGLIAIRGVAGVVDFEAHYRDADVVAFRERVSMLLDSDVDSAYPARWIGKVTVETTDGRSLHARIDEPKGDPGNRLSREELVAKALRLAGYRDGASRQEMAAVIDLVWNLPDQARIGRLFRS